MFFSTIQNTQIQWVGELLQSESILRHCAMFALKKANNVVSSGLDGRRRFVELIVAATPKNSLAYAEAGQSNLCHPVMA